MPGLKYNEYPVGTYDTSKILLQADIVTGALEQVNLPTLLPYKLFNALLLQTGTGNPTATTLFNNTGVTFTFTRTAAGSYTITSSGAFFNLLKTPFTIGIDNIWPKSYSVTLTSSTTAAFRQADGSGTLIDIMFYLPLEIRLYP